MYRHRYRSEDILSSIYNIGKEIDQNIDIIKKKRNTDIHVNMQIRIHIDTHIGRVVEIHTAI